MADRARLAAQLDELDRAVGDLDRYARTWSFDEWVSEGDRRRMVLNATYTATQACIDLAAQLVADLGMARPESYRELFPPLAASAVIDRPTADRLARWAGLRNVVAHLYWKLHLEQIDAAMRADLDPLRVLRRAAARLGMRSGAGGASEARDRGAPYRASPVRGARATPGPARKAVAAKPRPNRRRKR